MAAVSNSYVALGDSYAAGTGAGSYSGGDCFQSADSYPALLAARKGLALDLRACSGAATTDLPGQYPALTPETGFATLTVGGNDIGFAEVLTECAKPWWWGDSDEAIDQAVARIDQLLPGRLDQAYSAIRARAPQATFVVTGYPRLFSGLDCSLVTFFTTDEMSRLNSAADRLNDQIAAAAQRAGVLFADVAGAFTGHAVCEVVPWLNNASLPGVESFHPNDAGYGAYADVVGPLLGEVAPSVTAAEGPPAKTVTLHDRRIGLMSTARFQESRVADTLGTRFHLPDFRSDEARSAASRAGINMDELELLASGQRRALNAEWLTPAEIAAIRRTQS